MKKLFLLLTALVVAVGTLAAQNRTVSGIVTSAENGEPLVGATVMGVGTTVGTTTDMDGAFTLSLPEQVTKVSVSYVGMKTQEFTITPGKMNIVLEGDNKLDEVIAVAFGTAKKSAFTGSASVLNSEELNKHLTTNVANALVGSVPGLQMRGSSGAPGASAGSINIRGIASMYASTDPLVIVDGSPYSASLSNIPQNDIESISVLKDAASAALYGARGAAGVIIITTKKGKSENAQITVDMKWGANTRADQDYDLITDSGEYYEAVYDAFYNYYRYGQGNSHHNSFINANSAMLQEVGYNIYDVPQGQYLIGQNGKLNPYAKKGRTYTAANGETYYLTNDDWTDAAYRTALRQEYNVSISGATGKANYYASLGYLDEDGIIEYSSYRRLAARFKGDYQAKNWLKLGVNVGYTHGDTKSNPNLDQTSGSTNLMYYTNNIAPIYPIYVRTVDANGRPVIKSNAQGQIYDYGVANRETGYGGINRPFGQTGNPLGSNRYNSHSEEGNQLNGTFTADFTLTSWLKANITSNVIWGDTYRSIYDNPYFGPAAAVNGRIDKLNQQNIRTNNIQTLTFTKAFGKHNVNVLAGHEYYKTMLKYLRALASGGFSPEIPEINAFAYKYDSNGYQTAYNVEGYFASAQYDYDSKYFGSVSYRRDASSRFAKDHRWGNFWSIGGAWIVNKDFFQEVNWLNNLKIKASIGQQGNDNIGNWAYTDLYQLTSSSNTEMAPSFYRIGNPDITWETTTNFNIGLEFGVLDNRLTGSFDFYNKKTSDLLFWLSVPESLGSRGYYGNLGDIRNTGVELQLTGAIIRNKLIDWTINFNLSHNRTKILKLPKSKTQNLGGFMESDDSHTVSMWMEEGGSLYNLLLPECAGIDPETGQQLYWQDSNLTSENSAGQMASLTDRPGKLRDLKTTNPNLATRYCQGTNLPDVYGGFGTTIKIGSFDASASFDYQIGGKLFDTRYMNYMDPSQGGNGANFHKDWKNSWTPEKHTNIPHWQYNDQYITAKSDRFLTDASYLNFSSFTVGYTLPKFWDEISNIRIYCQGENLCFWSKRKGFDPRYSFSSGASVADYNAVRTISGGIQVQF